MYRSGYKYKLAPEEKIPNPKTYKEKTDQTILVETSFKCSQLQRKTSNYFSKVIKINVWENFNHCVQDNDNYNK